MSPDPKKGRANHFARPIASREKGGKPRPAALLLPNGGLLATKTVRCSRLNLRAPLGFLAAARNRREEVNFAGFPDRFHYPARAYLPVDRDRNGGFQVVAFQEMAGESWELAVKIRDQFPHVAAASRDPFFAVGEFSQQ